MKTLYTSILRYRLPQKAIKGDCPICGPKHRKTLSRYVDTQTGEPLPDIYGRCDRESNCGYHLSPYHKSPAGISYSDEVYQLAQQTKGLINSFPQRHRSMNNNIVNSAPITGKKLVYSLPDEVFNKSLGHYHQNQFARLLENHFGAEVAEQLLHRFKIGTSKYWNQSGACVFWLIDEQGRKRGGQVKLFDESFHTVKYVDQDGRKRSRTNWVHAVLTYQYKKAGQPQPDWLSAYVEQGEFAPCLFGLPQLELAPIDKPVALVEAPKTAVLCTPHFQQFTWLAVIGRSYLNAERLAPIKERSIVLFPDLSVDGKDYAYWKAKADSLRQQGFNIMVSDFLERIATDEDRAKGMDLADFLLKPDPSQPYWILETGEKILGELLAVERVNNYPAEWDEPSPPGAVPTLRAQDYFEWQRKFPPFNHLGLASLPG